MADYMDLFEREFMPLSSMQNNCDFVDFLFYKNLFIELAYIREISVGSALLLSTALREVEGIPMVRKLLSFFPEGIITEEGLISLIIHIANDKERVGLMRVNNEGIAIKHPSDIGNLIALRISLKQRPLFKNINKIPFQSFILLYLTVIPTFLTYTTYKKFYRVVPLTVDYIYNSLYKFSSLMLKKMTGLSLEYLPPSKFIRRVSTSDLPKLRQYYEWLKSLIIECENDGWYNCDIYLGLLWTKEWWFDILKEVVLETRISELMYSEGLGLDGGIISSVLTREKQDVEMVLRDIDKHIDLIDRLLNGVDDGNKKSKPETTPSLVEEMFTKYSIYDSWFIYDIFYPTIDEPFASLLKGGKFEAGISKFLAKEKSGVLFNKKDTVMLKDVLIVNDKDEICLVPLTIEESVNTCIKERWESGGEKLF